MQDNPQHHNFYYQSRKTPNIKQSAATRCLTKHNILFVTRPNWSSVYSAVENGLAWVCVPLVEYDTPAASDLENGRDWDD